MKTMAISDFKAHALQALQQVADSRESIVVTKRGKPIAEVIPFQSHERSPKPDALAGTLISSGDIVSPIGEEWNADD